ncbi:30S ribosomal protein S9 [Candidatus Dojkabacteria bacterium]|nr:30S ribosomal protein S9 [Candidatus Dojkabacteria bacterium]
MAANTGKGKYYEGIGRRKVSSARVRLFKGKNPNIVNNNLINEYFVVDKRMAKAQRPLVVSGLLDEYHFTAKTSGGGVTGQADAVCLGLARALVEMDETLKPALKKEGLLTRDPRMVQRKKYHHRKARKKPQFSKR